MSIKILCVDVESTVQREDGRIDGSPFNENNYLVSVGACWIRKGVTLDDIEYYFFDHNDIPADYNVRDPYNNLAYMIEQADVLVGHNIKFDLHWLRESNFDISGKKYYCTMIGEYVLARGQKMPLSLDETSKRRKVHLKQSQLVSDRFNKGEGYEAMPIDVVEEYGRSDVLSCAEVFLSQTAEYAVNENANLRKTRNMMNQMLEVLLEMEANGIYIDLDELDKVEKEYTQEKIQLETRMYEICKEVMGDVPVNLNSPAQLSEVIYSRRILDKALWKETFNVGLNSQGKPLPRPRLTDKEFASEVKRQTEIIYRKKGKTCEDCGGQGSFFKTKKNGDSFKKPTRCATCEGTGIAFDDTASIAGLKLTPKGVKDISANGFVTSKKTVDILLAQAQRKNNPLAIEFLNSMKRLNAVTTYLTSFCGGIKRNTRPDNLLHTTFNQCVTATGRLSSSDPNFQNQPRGGTFPVRKCVLSRFAGGKIIEADFSGLEFRVAGELSQDPQIIADILEGKDVHKQTASIINQCAVDQVTKDMRQQAKAYTFAPLYGGRGAGEPPHVQNYFREYFNIYEGLAQWHETLRNGVLATTKVVLPSGRELAWPDAKRETNGWVTYGTQIVNYPVQSFATADIVPLACIRAYKMMKHRHIQSLCVLTVHDSIVVDTHPDEIDIVKEILIDAMEGVADEIKKRYDYEMALPLAIEIKAGENWLNGDVIYE